MHNESASLLFHHFHIRDFANGIRCVDRAIIDQKLGIKSPIIMEMIVVILPANSKCGSNKVRDRSQCLTHKCKGSRTHMLE